jgi:hypothetical protein
MAKNAASSKKSAATIQDNEAPKAPAKSAILTAIEGAEAMENANVNTENATETTEEEQPALAWGGFAIEVGVTPPKLNRSGTEKYDWAAFPAPSNPEDPKTWPSVFIPNVGSNGISKSIRKFREKLQKADPNAAVPEFSLTNSKEPKGVRVFRKK